MGKKDRVDPEDRWVVINGMPAVVIEPGMKMKDLPADIRMAGVPHEGALHPFDFFGGTFRAITWRGAPGDWPEPHYTALSAGDALAEDQKGGVIPIFKHEMQKGDDMPETKENAVGTYTVTVRKIIFAETSIELTAEDLEGADGDVNKALSKAIVDQDDDELTTEVTGVQIEDIIDDPRYNGEGKPW